jgi:hypothetical protein
MHWRNRTKGDSMKLYFRPINSVKTEMAITAGDAQDYLHQRDFDPSDLHQQWLFTQDSQNSALVHAGLSANLILNRTSSYAIDVVGGTFDDNKSLQTYPLTGNGNQLWDWTVDLSGNNVIQGHGEPFFIDIPDGDPRADLQVYHQNQSANQEWTSPGAFRQLIYGFKISCLASAPKVLDVPNGSQNPGIVIQQFANPGVACFNQYWTVWPADRAGAAFDDITQIQSGTSVRIQSVCNGLFLRPQAIVDNQAWVEQAPDGGTDRELWTMTGSNVDGWKIESTLAPGLVLDIPNSSRDDHVDLQVYQDNGGENQRWIFL